MTTTKSCVKREDGEKIVLKTVSNYEQNQNLERMWGVVDAVDAEAVVEGQTWRPRGEQRQLQAFTRRLWGAGLAH